MIAGMPDRCQQVGIMRIAGGISVGKHHPDRRLTPRALTTICQADRFGVDDASTGTKCTGELEIIGDGITLKRITQYKGHAPEYFDVDIKGVDILTIKVSGESITETVNGQVLPTQQTVCDVFDIKLHY